MTPSTLARLRLIGKTAPPNGLLIKFHMRVRPTLPGVSVAPIRATFFGAKIASDLHAGVFENTRLFANLRFDRFLFNVLSLDLRYEKLYSNDRDVGFFDELMTLRMVDIQALAIIKVKPYVISLGVSLSYDENTHLTSTIDAVVRIVLL